MSRALRRQLLIRRTPLIGRGATQWAIGFLLGSTGTVAALAVVFSLLAGGARPVPPSEPPAGVVGQWQKEWAPRTWDDPPRRSAGSGLPSVR